MPDTLATAVHASLQWLFEETLDLSTVVDSAQLTYAASLADGTGSGQADQLWHDTRTLAAGAHDDLDLTALSLAIHGGSINVGFAKLKAILLVNTATTAGANLQLDSSVANGLVTPFAGSAASKTQIPADSCLLWVNKLSGWTVTGGTGDILRVTNTGAGSVTYKIVLVGTTA